MQKKKIHSKIFLVAVFTCKQYRIFVKGIKREGGGVGEGNEQAIKISL
jgi:hypothetical protein